MRKFDAVRRRFRDLLSSTPRVWFVAEYQILEERAAEPSKAGDLPGLIFHHQLDPEGDGIVPFISYWESRADFEACRAPLEQRLGTATLRRKAWVRQVSVKREPFWRRVTLYAVLLHMVAFLGALAALEDYKAWLFEEPMVALDVEAIDPINLPEGSPLRTHLLLANQRANAAARISNLRARLSSARQSAPISLGSSQYLGKEGSLRLPIQTQALKAGLYKLEIDGRSRSGLMRGWKPLYLRRDVRVWPHRPQIHFSLNPDSTVRSELRGLLQIGEDAPEGLECFVTLVKEPSIRFGPMEFKGVTDWPEPTVSRDGSVSTQIWATLPLRAFSEINFSIYLEGQPISGWPQVLNDLTSECFQRTKEVMP